MSFGGDGLGGGSQRRIALGDDDQSFVPFSPDLNVPNLDAADVAVVCGVQGIGQAQNCG
jgi:hypothetical protein